VVNFVPQPSQGLDTQHAPVGRRAQAAPSSELNRANPEKNPLSKGHAWPVWHEPPSPSTWQPAGRASPGPATNGPAAAASRSPTPSPGVAAGWPRRPPKDVGGEVMTKRVGVTLRLQRLNGIVRSSSGPGQFMLWEIAR
jgi:hypothetical protein